MYILLATALIIVCEVHVIVCSDGAGGSDTTTPAADDGGQSQTDGSEKLKMSLPVFYILISLFINAYVINM